MKVSASSVMATLMPIEPISINGLRPILSTKNIETTAKVRFTMPIKAVWNSADSLPKPADLKMARRIIHHHVDPGDLLKYRQQDADDQEPKHPRLEEFRDLALLSLLTDSSISVNSRRAAPLAIDARQRIQGLRLLLSFPPASAGFPEQRTGTQTAGTTGRP